MGAAKPRRMPRTPARRMAQPQQMAKPRQTARVLHQQARLPPSQQPPRRSDDGTSRHPPGALDVAYFEAKARHRAKALNAMHAVGGDVCMLPTEVSALN